MGHNTKTKIQIDPWKIPRPWKGGDKTQKWRSFERGKIFFLLPSKLTPLDVRTDEAGRGREKTIKRNIKMTMKSGQVRCITAMASA